jgi:pentatricopeptide repeat protein
MRRSGRRSSPQAVLDQAVTSQLPDGLIYALLVEAYVKPDRLPDARRVFERAELAGMPSSCACESLLRGYVKAGHTHRARQLANKARRCGLLPSMP